LLFLKKRIGNVQWQLVLCDFGIAKISSHKTVHDERSNSSNNYSFKGTLAYAAPELFANSAPEDYKPCDVYGLGMLFWSIFYRKKPFAQQKSAVNNRIEEMKITMAILNNERPAIDDMCPYEIKEMITKCWNQQVHERPTIQTLLQEITALEAQYSPSQQQQQQLVMPTISLLEPKAKTTTEQYFSMFNTIPIEELVFEKLKGTGSFALVFQGKWKDKPVAIKQFERSSMPPLEAQLLKREIDIQAYVHTHMYFHVMLILGSLTHPSSN